MNRRTIAIVTNSCEFSDSESFCIKFTLFSINHVFQCSIRVIGSFMVDVRDASQIQSYIERILEFMFSQSQYNSYSFERGMELKV